jgi:hypothetical protein
MSDALRKVYEGSGALDRFLTSKRLLICFAVVEWGHLAI